MHKSDLKSDKEEREKVEIKKYHFFFFLVVFDNITK